MKAIEQIYENYKTSLNEETPYTEEQRKEFDSLSNILDNAITGDIPKITGNSSSRFLSIVWHLPEPPKRQASL